jgi:type I restriction enzyme S subunit
MGRCGSTDSVFFIEEDYWSHNTSLFVTNFQGNEPRWCYYLLRTISKADHAGKSAVPAVDRKDLFDIRVPEPPAAEQLAIVDYIEKECGLFDAAIERVECEMELIHAYRTRLIADVVTGKGDVRHLAPEGSEAAVEELEPWEAEEIIDGEGAEDLEVDEEAVDADD